MDYRLKLVKLLLEAKDNTQHLNRLKGRYMALAAAHYLGWDEDYDTNDKEADITDEDGLTGEVKWHGAEDALPKGIHYYSQSDAEYFDALPDMAPGQELHNYNDDIIHAKRSNDGKRITIVLKDENMMIVKMLEARTVHLIGNPTSVHVVVPDPEDHEHFKKELKLSPTIDPSTITRGGKATRRIRSNPSAGGPSFSRRISLNPMDREAVPETVDRAKANAANMHEKGSFDHALAEITKNENERIEQLMGKATVEAVEEAEKRKKALDELTKIHHEHRRAHKQRSKKSS